jgi:hypothetical protein
MAAEDPLAAAIEQARAAHEVAEERAAKERAKREREQAERAEAEARLRQDLHTVGKSFVQRARAGKVKSHRVPVCVEIRDKYQGFFNRRKVGKQAVWEEHEAWIIQQPQYDELTTFAPPTPGIIVLDDGRVIGLMSDASSLPHGTLEDIKHRLAEFLVTRGAR